MKRNGSPHRRPAELAGLNEPVWMCLDAWNKRIGPVRASDESGAAAMAVERYDVEAKDVARIERVR